MNHPFDFKQDVAPWNNCGFKSKKVELLARRCFVAGEQEEVQLEITVRESYGNTDDLDNVLHASITLTPEQAAQLVWALTVPVNAKL